MNAPSFRIVPKLGAAFLFIVVSQALNAETLLTAGTYTDYYDVDGCFDFKILDPRAYPTKRTYTITGTCILQKGDGPKAQANLLVYASYDRVNRIARESGHLWFDTLNHGGETHFIGQTKLSLRTPSDTDLSYSCNEDPWLKGGVCSIITDDIAHDSFAGDFVIAGENLAGPESLFLFYFQKSPPIPLSRGATPQLQNYLESTYLDPGRAPKIVSPSHGMAYAVGDLVIDVDKAPPDLSNWQINFTYPPEASKVTLTWQRWNPITNGWEAAALLEELENIDTQPNRLVPTTWIHEGQWRLHAKHDVPTWARSSRSEFWIGDRVNYGYSSDFDMHAPLPEQAHTVVDNQGLYPVQFHVGHSLTQPIEVQYDTYRIDPQGAEHGWGSPYSKLVNCCQSSNQPWTLHLDKGWWQFRVRWQKNSSSNLKAPWTKPVRFWAGDAFDVQKIFQLGQGHIPQQQSSGTSSTRPSQGSDRVTSATALRPSQQVITALTPTTSRSGDINSRADLIVVKYWAETDGQSNISYHNWLVRNVGARQAPASKLTVTCKQMGAVSCPWGEGGYSLAVKRLQPARADLAPEQDIAAGDVVSLGMDAPTAHAKFRFVAWADSADNVKEIDERNNHLVSDYDSAGSLQPRPSSNFANLAQIGSAHSGQITQLNRKSGQVANLTRNSVDSAQRTQGDVETTSRVIPGPSQITLLSPRDRQVVEGDVVLEVRRPRDLHSLDLQLSFDRWANSDWQRQSLRGYTIMPGGTNTLAVPRNRFGSGGRWRVCVHEPGRRCAEEQWHMFGVSK